MNKRQDPDARHKFVLCDAVGWVLCEETEGRCSVLEQLFVPVSYSGSAEQ